LLLGRRWLDMEYGLDLAAFDQVQVKIANTATATHFQTDIRLSAIATYLRDAAPGLLKGYMKCEAHRDYLPVTGATEPINLPTQGKLRRLLVHSRPGVSGTYVAQTPAANLAYQLTLEAKSGAVKIMDHSSARLALENWYDIQGEVITHGNVYINADGGFDVGIGRVVGRAGISVAKDGAGSATIPTTADNNDFTQQNETYEADSPIAQWWRGTQYHNIVALPVSWGETPETWLDLDAMKQVTLEILTRSGITVGTSAYNRVLLERPATGADRLL